MIYDRTDDDTTRWGRPAAMAVLIAVALVFGFGCWESMSDSMVEAFTSADYQVDPADDANVHRAELLDDISRATERIDFAASSLVDEDVAQALVDANDRGVTVRVVADWDAREEPGFVLLEDDDVLPVYGNGELSYLPEPTLASVLDHCEENSASQFNRCTRGQDGDQGQMVRPGHFNLMSHDFAVIDDHIVWNFPPFDDAARDWIGWRIDSSTLAYDFAREFQQMHGGVFATTLSFYNGPLKSMTDNRITYLTDKGFMKVWFNPQERLMKTVIDRVYKAKASVWVMSDNLVDPNLISALEYKAQNGFDVRVLVHPDEQASGDSLDALEELDLRWAPDDYDHLPTMIVVDAERDRSGDARPRYVLSLSHALIRARPFEVRTAQPNDLVYIYPSDLFTDGNLWELGESASMIHKDATINRYQDYWLGLWRDAQSN